MGGKAVIPAGMRGSYEQFQFAPATRAGDLLILSGQIGVGPDGNAIPDLEAQFTRAFEQIGEILREAGLSFADIVDLHTFHVGLQAHLGAFMAVKSRYIAEPFPSWTAIGVSELALPGIAVEIKATAAY
ncbi:RidA family protein [Iodidimonas sp. SYSU 1G8]|uniref:RidA family protein n=1 Tax=Iodidimonas sp. SYSU 1G8 TaxID=3133967 RepID=UPI0031FE8480